MDFLAEPGIDIESCLRSNIQTSTVPALVQHTLVQFLGHGVLSSINTDDPAVQCIEIEHEYRIAAYQDGLTLAEIGTAQENGLKMTFLIEQKKQTLRTKVQGVWLFYPHNAALAARTPSNAPGGKLSAVTP